jgi:hypothetical protein
VQSDAVQWAHCSILARIASCLGGSSRIAMTSAAHVLRVVRTLVSGLSAAQCSAPSSGAIRNKQSTTHGVRPLTDQWFQRCDSRLF